MTRLENRQASQSPVDGLRPVQVHCYAGYRGRERPVRYALGEESREIREILATEIIEWSKTRVRYSRFLAIDERERKIILWYAHALKQWFLDEDVQWV